MSAKITFFPSGNGDLTLTRLLCERLSRDARAAGTSTHSSSAIPTRITVPDSANTATWVRG